MWEINAVYSKELVVQEVSNCLAVSALLKVADVEPSAYWSCYTGDSSGNKGLEMCSLTELSRGI